jgi:hypothetical protein
MAERETVPVAVITGASEGLGLALAKEFARARHALLLVARTRTALETAAQNIAQAMDVKVHIQSADLSTIEGCESVERALDEYGLHAEFLVNNAGIGLSGPFVENESDDLMRLADLNMRALTDLTHRVLPGMIARGSGGVLNVASLGGFLPGPYQAAYYASKAYVISLSEALSHEVAGTNVRVSVLAPGPIRTRFHRRMGAQNDNYIRFMGLMSVEQVAQSAYVNFMRGRKVIVPGAVNMVSALFLRILPHTLLVPFAAWLLRRREGTSDA